MLAIQLVTVLCHVQDINVSKNKNKSEISLNQKYMLHTATNQNSVTHCNIKKKNYAH